MTINSWGSANPAEVAKGGTGLSTIPDGHILLGSGTDPVTALDVTAKGSILVGDGTTDPIALAVGSDDYVVTADSGETSGLKYKIKYPQWLSQIDTNGTPVSEMVFSSLDSTYNVYLFTFHNVVAQTDGVSFLVRTSTDGITYDSSTGDYRYQYYDGGADRSSSSADQVQLTRDRDWETTL
jgi:hypothetical protein